MVRFNCPCGKQLQAKEEYAGQRTRCPECGRELVIPGAEAFQAARPPRTHEDDEDRRPMEGTSGKAITALVLGLPPCFIGTGIPAAIFGFLSLRDIDNSGGRLKGRGMAITGIVLGLIGVALMVTLVPFGLILPAVQKVRGAANRMSSSNNLKQLALAVHNYHAVHNTMPPAVVYNQDGQPLYSWRVLVLPYLDEGQLYNQFRLDEPWDSTYNKSLLAQMPRAFHDPGLALDPGLTTYQVINGKGAAFESDPQNGLIPLQGIKGAFQAKPKIGLQHFPDGTANTFLIVEAEQAVPWTKPQDLDYFPDGPLPRFGKTRAGGFNAAMGDGAVKTIQPSLPQQTLRALITRNGGEVLPDF